MLTTSAQKLENKIDISLLVLRVSLGSLMLFHGIFKLIHGVEWIVEILNFKGLPGYIAYCSYLGEIIAPVLIIIGIRTRIFAAILSLTLLNAFLLMHTKDFLLTNPQNGGWQIELIFIYFIVSISLVITGGGKYSLTKNTKFD